MKIHIHTLGCKVNQYESQAMETLLAQHGHEIYKTPDGCDAIIINTCAVTAESVRKSRQTVRKMRGEASDTIIAICGCWSQTEPENAQKIGADIVFGSGDRIKLVEALEKEFVERSKVVCVDNALRRRQFEILPAGSADNRTRALLKIEDGCVNFCSYCIIPYSRGPIRSLPLAGIAEQSKTLEEKGFKEIVITGIEIASYGHDLPEKPTLADAIKTAAESAPTCRIHMGSLEPRCITEEFCKMLYSLPNVCPHFHLSLQSGSDGVLKRMRRKYDTYRFYKSVTLLRKYFPNCGITADLITGFPGETDEEFSETIAFLEKVRFSAVHVFPYSVRPGTVAASMDDQIEKSVKHARARTASKCADRCADEFLKAQIGTVQSVLFEQMSDGYWLGHTPNYCLVRVKGEITRNSILNVQINGVENGILLGVVTL